MKGGRLGRGAAVACAMVATWSPSAGAAVRNDEVLVRYTDAATPSQRTKARVAVDGTRIGALPLPDAEVLRVGSGEAEEAAAALSRRSDIAWAEPNARVRALVAPEAEGVPPAPERFASQWGLHNVAQPVRGSRGTADADIDAPEAWGLVDDLPGPVVGVVDTGVRPEHPALAGRVVGMWSAFSRGGPEDRNGHGTHVAGTVAARGGEAGLFGAGGPARIHSFRVLDRRGSGRLDGLVKGLEAAGAAGLRVVNVSIGGSASMAVADVLARHRDTLYVFAAGNGRQDLDHYPAMQLCDLPNENLLCVTASDQADRLATFGAHGRYDVDLAAPGVDILGPFVATEIVRADDFEGPLEAQWTAEAGWSRVPAGEGHVLQGEVPPPGETSIVLDEPFSVMDLPDCYLEFEADVPAGSHIAVDIKRGSEDTFYDGSTEDGTWLAGPHRGSFRVSLDEWSDWAHIQVRLRLVTRSELLGGHRVTVDDFRVTCSGADAPAGADDVRWLSGTSMAAPHAAGAAALVVAGRPWITPLGLRSKLICSIDPSATLEDTVSGGRLNAERALRTRAAEPDPRWSGRMRTVLGGRKYVDVAVERDGSLLVVDNSEHRVLRVRPGGTPEVVAGGPADESGDGGPATAAGIEHPYAVSAMPDGGFLVAHASRVRRVAPDGTIQTVAGGLGYGEAPDGAAAVGDDRFARVGDVVSAPGGGMYLADLNNDRLVFVDPEGTLHVVARVWDIESVDLLSDGNLVVGSENGVFRVTPGGVVTPLTAQDRLLEGGQGDGGPARDAAVRAVGVSAHGDGILIADPAGDTIRRIDAGGRIDRVAGNGIRGHAGDGGPATEARLHQPVRVAAAPDGSFVFVDYQNGAINRVTTERLAVPPVHVGCSGQEEAAVQLEPPPGHGAQPPADPGPGDEPPTEPGASPPPSGGSAGPGPPSPATQPASGPAPAGPPRSMGPRPAFVGSGPAKLKVRRARVRNGGLDVLARITRRASGTVTTRYRSAGRTITFDAPIADGTVRFTRRLPRRQRRPPTGIVEIAYPGDARVWPARTRVRAASQPARLERRVVSLSRGRLRVAGEISRRARGVVRVQLDYRTPDGRLEAWRGRARVRAGRWSLEETVPPAARAGGYVTMQFTGYERARGGPMRGEQDAKAVVASG